MEPSSRSVELYKQLYNLTDPNIFRVKVSKVGILEYLKLKRSGAYPEIFNRKGLRLDVLQIDLEYMEQYFDELLQMVANYRN